MADKSWQFELEDGLHTVRLVHGFGSGHRDIFLDGKLHEQMRRLRHLLFDCGSRHELVVNGHCCVVCINLRWLYPGFTYRFTVDDRVIEEYRAPTWRQPPIPEP
ncbi:MAG TPA: hypothetical protein VF600_15765 [Abditibacteriaceae bacterium]